MEPRILSAHPWNRDECGNLRQCAIEPATYALHCTVYDRYAGGKHEKTKIRKYEPNGLRAGRAWSLNRSQPGPPQQPSSLTAATQRVKGPQNPEALIAIKLFQLGRTQIPDFAVLSLASCSARSWAVVKNSSLQMSFVPPRPVANDLRL